MIEEAEETENVQEEMFPVGVLKGDRLSLANLHRPGLPVELAVKLKAGEVPLRDGLVDPNKQVRVAVTCEASEYRQRPVREERNGQMQIVGWKYICDLKPIYSEPLGDNRNAVLLAFEQLLAADAQAAGVMLDDLQERFTEYMRTGQVEV